MKKKFTERLTIFIAISVVLVIIYVGVLFYIIKRTPPNKQEAKGNYLIF